MLVHASADVLKLDENAQQASLFRCFTPRREYRSAMCNVPFSFSSQRAIFGCILLWGFKEREHFLCGACGASYESALESGWKCVL